MMGYVNSRYTQFLKIFYTCKNFTKNFLKVLLLKTVKVFGRLNNMLYLCT